MLACKLTMTFMTEIKNKTRSRTTKLIQQLLKVAKVSISHLESLKCSEMVYKLRPTIMKDYFTILQCK